MTDIFLSYTERDRDTARRVAEALGSVGWSVWWDRRIPAGETWRSVLEHALEDMRCMVVLWSTKSVESEWVYEEASEGRRLGKLVPVMIETVRPPAGFREIQAADLTGWDGSPDFDGLRMLLSDLEHLLGKPVVTTADDTASAGRHADRPAPAEHDPDPPYNPTDVPGRAKPAAHGASARWPLRAMAGGGLLAGVVAFIGLSSRQQPAPPTPTPTPAAATATATESASREPERSVPPVVPAAVPPDPSPPTASVLPDISRDSRTALTSSATRLSRSKPQPEPSSPIKRSDSTRLSSARCADLLARIQLGETLSEASQSRFDKEC
ncbi:MAG: toll/interleukin-1 receptor domain-containing protein [Hydrogenophaga sp.]|uniref:toll/interleukin-1 receptor domain-containing protein n=1 Tax=Hydrogenophaga sp. TaxID=1904254 RepID=UPI0025BD5603|nr:toll/interleukin-1 receptor domain-containing protein [Hydrogenophaga sp.]MBT9553551.1 toll/interleukin-1 receptor domain-containing protein [Hydrogenophaga sp.]